MRNLQDYKLFSILIICISFIFGFSQIGAFAYESTVNNEMPSQTKDGLEDSTQENNTNTNNEKQVVVSESIIPVEDIEETHSWINSFNQIEIPSNTPFSFLSYMNEHGVNQFSHQTLSIIASAIYRTILPTNFEVIERHTSRELPSYIELGFEARILPDQSDFAFINPNETTYTLHFELKERELYVTVLGEPLQKKYKVLLENEESFEPKTIIQYDSTLSSGEKEIKEVGKQGHLVEVTRQIFDQNGSSIDHVRISEDYYPPIHHIKVYSLQNGITETNPNIGTDNPDGQAPDTTDQESNQNPSEGENEKDNESSSGNTNDTTNNDNVDSKNGIDEEEDLWGIPDYIKGE